MTDNPLYDLPEGGPEDHVAVWKMGDMSGALIAIEWEGVSVGARILTPKGSKLIKGSTLKFTGVEANKGNAEKSVVVFVAHDMLDDFGNWILAQSKRIKAGDTGRVVHAGSDTL